MVWNAHWLQHVPGGPRTPFSVDDHWRLQLLVPAGALEDKEASVVSYYPPLPLLMSMNELKVGVISPLGVLPSPHL